MMIKAKKKNIPKLSPLYTPVLSNRRYEHSKTNLRPRPPPSQPFPARHHSIFVKKVNQLIFKKLKKIIEWLCTDMNYILLQKVSPRLISILKNRTSKVFVRFRLDGTTWPPMIVYKAEVSNYKIFNFHEQVRQETEWRVLFNDKPLERSRSVLPPLRQYKHSELKTRKSSSFESKKASDLKYRNYWNRKGMIRLDWNQINSKSF